MSIPAPACPAALSASPIALAGQAWASPDDVRAEPVAASAESAAVDGNTTVSDVVVTVRRREEKLQDVPIAVSAVSGQVLAEDRLDRTAGEPALGGVVEDYAAGAVDLDRGPGSKLSQRPSWQPWRQPWPSWRQLFLPWPFFFWLFSASSAFSA